MKKLFILLLIGIFLSACSEKNSLNEPTVSSEISFVKMPASSQIAKTVVFSKIINGTAGGQIYFYHSYTAADGKCVQISGSLEVPAGAFTGEKEISLNLDDEYAMIDFSPSPYQFNIPLKLNLQYKGLNLSGVNSGTINFYYISDDGAAAELIKAQSRIFNLSSGTLGIIKAELNHFSRFGWVI